MVSQLIFADDRSPGADAAWAWVDAQQWSGWNIDVLTVEPVGVSHRDPVEPREWLPPSPRVPSQDTALADVGYLVADGDPRDVLASVHGNLLVIGQRGSGLLKRLHIGSVAESLLDCPSTPLLIVRESKPVRQVLLAVDGSTHALNAAHTLASLPWISAAHVTVIGVDEGDHRAGSAVREAAEVLTGKAASIDERTLEYDEQFISVNVRYQLEEYIKDHSFDLLAMGTKGLRGVRRLRLGSVADYLAHHATCSVLLARDVHSD